VSNSPPRSELIIGEELKNMFMLTVIIATLLGSVGMATAQQPKKVPRIGYLSTGDAASESTRAEAIRLTLRDLGYIEGQNIATLYRYAEGKAERHPELFAELVRLKVDIIVVAGGAPTVRAAKNATKTIPIVWQAAAPILSKQA
jgi:putative ABC transport system substrate-binding protein